MIQTPAEQLRILTLRWGFLSGLFWVGCGLLIAPLILRPTAPPPGLSPPGLSPGQQQEIAQIYSEIDNGEHALIIIGALFLIWSIGLLLIATRLAHIIPLHQLVIPSRVVFVVLWLIGLLVFIWLINRYVPVVFMTTPVYQDKFSP